MGSGSGSTGSFKEGGSDWIGRDPLKGKDILHSKFENRIMALTKIIYIKIRVFNMENFSGDGINSVPLFLVHRGIALRQIF